jgi:alpha-glucosidase
MRKKKIHQNRVLKILLITVQLVIYNNTIQSQQNKIFQINSPDKSIVVTVNISNDVAFSVLLDGENILKQTTISMNINEQELGKNPEVIDIIAESIDEKIIPVIKEKFNIIHDNYNQLTITFKNNFDIIFRVYNNGMAYRFVTKFNEEIKVYSEEADFNFVKGSSMYFPEEESFFSHNERLYKYIKMDTVTSGLLASLPLLVESNSIKILIAESSLKDYPGMWILTGEKKSLQATFPKYALEEKLKSNSDRNVHVAKSANYIAKTKGNRKFPWRVLAIARSDKELITNQLVYQLGEEQQIKDVSWIKPGKVAWDWWNALNVYGVDFKSGVNTETYKYYIDFASRFGIEYIILDEGWYKLGNLMDVVPEINMEEIIAYGKEKNVGIILWVVWKTLDDQLKIALDQFEKWGVKGIKVDFMQRDDQKMVNYYWKIAKEAAKRKLLVDFHGAYKPSGLRRAYPNVITREGVKGLENNKWSKDITPTHNLTLPFTRMVAGPMDYTPGSMLNAQPKMFRINWNRPMSMGTRAHQIAMYVIYESPLQMLADSPSNYLSELESTMFISKIPTVWDDTKVLEAKVGEYLIIARKNNNKWYIGAMTNEVSREFTINLSFLDDEEYTADIIKDGINADRYAGDYKKEIKTVIKSDSLKIKLAQEGGWVAILDAK